VSLTPRYGPISAWCDHSGMGRSATYEALGRGDLRAIKLGTRTLIDFEHGLEYLRSLPAAEITTGRRRPRVMENQHRSDDGPMPSSGPGTGQPRRRRRAASVAVGYLANQG
jgi:hypothetical protein